MKGFESHIWAYLFELSEKYEIVLGIDKSALVITVRKAHSKMEITREIHRLQKSYSQSSVDAIVRNEVRRIIDELNSIKVKDNV